MEDSNKQNKVWLLLIAFLFIIFGSSFLAFGLINQIFLKTTQIEPVQEVKPSITTLPTEASVSAKVLKVVDGDTIEVGINNQEYKVRYIGVDTPETVDPRRPVGCFGKEASAENKSLVEGKEVLLVKDISDTDKFGRLLRYVYLKQEDGNILFVNDYLVRQGYAKVSTYPPDVKYINQFLEAEREAREFKRGLWQKCI